MLIKEYAYYLVKWIENYKDNLFVRIYIRKSKL